MKMDAENRKIEVVEDDMGEGYHDPLEDYELEMKIEKQKRPKYKIDGQLKKR
jgi:hypothetical protein